MERLSYYRAEYYHTTLEAKSGNSRTPREADAYPSGSLLGTLPRIDNNSKA